MGLFDPLKKIFSGGYAPTSSFTPPVPVIRKPALNFNMSPTAKNAIFAPKPVANTTPVAGPVLPKIGPSPVAPSGNNYTVMAGDSLSAIASKNKTSLAEILNLNPQYRANPNLIRPGESISLKGAPVTPMTAASATPPIINAATGGVQAPVIPQITAPIATPASLTRVDTGSVGADGKPIYDVFSGTEHIQDPNDPRLRGVDIAGLPSGQAPQGFQSQFNPVAPATPIVPPAPVVPPPPTAYDKAVSAYEKAIPMTPEEEATQNEINNLDASIRTGIVGEANRPIALPFITGRQKAIEQRGLALQQPLQAKAALLQAKRIATLDASKFRLDQEKTKIADAKEASKPVSVSQGSSLVDPSTGKVIYKAPNAALSIAEKYGPGVIGEYNFYAEQEKNAGKTPKTFEEYRSIRESTTGMPTSYKEWTLAGKQGTYTDWVRKTGLRPLPPTQATTLSEGFQIPLVTKSLDEMFDEKSSNYKGGLFGPLEGRWALNPWDVEHKTIDDDLRRAAQVIGRYMEGGVLRKEDEIKYRAMLPKITDRVEVARDKLKGIKDLLASKSQQYLSDYEAAGFDISGFVGKLPGTEKANTDGGRDALDEALDQAGFKSEGSVSTNAQSIANAIRTVESGGNYNAKGASGESGAYQFMPSTWKGWAGKYLGNANAPMTKANQDKVALAKINDLLKQGYNAQQIALIWNGGSPTIKKGTNSFGVKYDTGAYAQKVLKQLA